MSRFCPVRRLAVLSALSAGLFVLAPGAGGQPPGKAGKVMSAKGQVKTGVHHFKMDAGSMYKVRVEANGFTPAVTIRPGMFLGVGGGFEGPFGNPFGGGGGTVQGDTFEAFFLPTETREYRITVSPDLNDEELDGQLFDYAVTVTPIPMSRQPILDEKGRTTANDPPYQRPGGGGNLAPYKAFNVNLKANQVYIMTLQMTQQGEYDPYLIVEGPGGKVVAQNDDDGMSLNSRIVYSPKKSGEYRIIASGLGNRTGAFHLKVIGTETGSGGKAAPRDDEPAPPATRKKKEE